VAPRGAGGRHGGRVTSEDPAWLAWSRALADLSPGAFEAVLAAAQGEGEERALYRARFRWRVDECLKFCLPAVFEFPWNDFQADFLRAPKAHWRDRVPAITREAWAAPRGTAKSTCTQG